MDDVLKASVLITVASVVTQLGEAGRDLNLVLGIIEMEDDDFIDTAALRHCLIRILDAIDALCDSAEDVLPPIGQLRETTASMRKKYVAL